MTNRRLCRRGASAEAVAPGDLPGLKTEDGIADLGEFRAAWFRHSEGNTITLAQLAEPPFLYSP